MKATYNTTKQRQHHSSLILTIPKYQAQHVHDHTCLLNIHSFILSTIELAIRWSS